MELKVDMMSLQVTLCDQYLSALKQLSACSAIQFIRFNSNCDTNRLTSMCQAQSPQS